MNKLDNPTLTKESSDSIHLPKNKKKATQPNRRKGKAKKNKKDRDRYKGRKERNNRKNGEKSQMSEIDGGNGFNNSRDMGNSELKDTAPLEHSAQPKQNSWLTKLFFG